MKSYYQRILVCLQSVAASMLLSIRFPATALQHEETVTSVEQAQQLIKNHRGKPQGFRLAVPLTKPLLLHGKPVPLDLAMAIITDGILAKGWMPNGFVDKRGVRYYRYSR